MASGIASIEKLNGENYATWSIQMKSLLITMDLWDTIVVNCPEASPQKDVWKSSDSKALATITLSVKPSELIHIKNCITAKSAWYVLSSLYRANTASRKVNLFKRLVRFKFQNSEKFASQINEFCSIVDDLKEIGIALNEDLLSILLLCSLPDEMESFVVAIESRDSLPKYETLISKILEEEMRQGGKSNNLAENVFAANSKGVKQRNNRRSFNSSGNNNYKNKNSSKSSNSSNSNNNSRNEGYVNNMNNFKCFRCGKKGHIRSQCKEKQESDFACSLTEGNRSSTEMWILDSGATSHMCRSRECFATLTEAKQKIVLASGECIEAEGKGNIQLKTEFCNLKLRNVLFVPKLHSNFISISKIVKAGHTVKFEDEKAVMKSKNEEKILTADLKSEMFIANIKSIKNIKNVESICGLINDNNGVKWHQRFGHLNINDLNKLSEKNMVNGFNVKLPKSIECVTCAVCKISASPYKSYGSVQTGDILELVHTDLCGPIGTKTLSGASYFITFIDDYSRYTTTYFLKNKSDAFDAFCLFAGTAEKQTGRKIKTVRSDNGTEFVNSKFKNFFAKNGIVHQTTVSYSPQQNGVSERANRTLVEMARCLLESSGLPQSLWGEAVNTATYLRNRVPTKILDDVTPYERWVGKKPSVFHLKTFGCDAVALNKGPKPKGGKFLPKGNKMKFDGYDLATKGYRLYNPTTRQIIISRDVIFFEQSFEKLSIPDQEEEEQFFFKFFKQNYPQFVPEDEQEEDLPDAVGDDDQKDDEENPSSEETDRDETIVVENKRKRGRPKLVKTGSGVGRRRKVYCTENGPEMLNSVIENPETVAEALESEDSERWKEAMQVEFDSLIKNKTWQLVEKPRGKNIIGSKWVFAVKRNPDGSVEKFKARLVAQGCSQKQNVDYKETFAPVVRHSTIRLLLALAAKYKLLVNHVDIVAAYLNGDINDEVYMVQPPLFEDQNNPNKVCKLNKALYGLKQAGREWNKKVNDILLNMGFMRCQTDTCVYIRKNCTNICIIAVYVDDMLLACSKEVDMKNIITELNKQVEAIDRGPISFYLGMEIAREGLRGDIKIHQNKYTNEILEKWGMANCKPAATPWPSGTVLEKCNEACEDLDVKGYQSLIGALMYLAVITRPDLIHVVSRLSQFNSHPHEEHFKAAKHVLRYLRMKPGGKISYSANFKDFNIFTDADWGCDANDRKSYSGHVLFMSGGPVAWESRKQPIVALSTMEAEYIALCQGTKEAVFHRNLLKELSFGEYIERPTTIFCDNQSASFMVKNPAVHKRSKHIDIRYHYIREQFEENAKISSMFPLMRIWLTS